MKKIIGILIIVVIIVFTLLIINKYSPKDNDRKKTVDISNLVCQRNMIIPDEYSELELITIRFNEKGIIKEYEQKYTMSFSNNDDALKYYEELKINNPSDNTIINGNEVTYSYITIVNEEDNKYFGKDKKEIKDIYINEFYYECE